MRHFLERQHIGIDHAQIRVIPELTAQQTDGLQVGVDLVRAPCHEARDQHALKGAHVEFRLDGRLDANLVEVGTRDDAHQESDATERPHDWPDR